MEEKELEQLREKKKYNEAIGVICKKVFPFETAHTDTRDDNEYCEPSDCKNLLASFDYDDKHWVIYTK